MQRPSKRKAEKSRYRILLVSIYFVILYFDLGFNTFVEHDAISAFQDSLFACLIFHAEEGLSLCLCRLDARGTYQSRDRAPLLLKLFRACNNHSSFGYTLLVIPRKRPVHQAKGHNKETF